jgi:hypothetical protein
MLAVIAALGPVIPAPSRQLSLDAPLGRALYIGAIVFAAGMVLITSRRSEKARGDERATERRLQKESFDELKAYVAEHGDAGLKAKIEDLQGKLDFNETDSDGIFT